MFLKTLSRPLSCLLGIWGLSGCAEQREPINRVQADALSKSFFIGDIRESSDDPVFLSRNMVVDASENQSLVGINTASGLERIRWQITENMLLARRAYSLTQADNKGTGTEPNGDVLGAYKIKGHFDIRNAYNSSTGEELNVVEENSSDRVWSEREYFRVDWSQNLVNTPTWGQMFFGKTFGDIKLTPVSFVENDPTSSNAPHFELEDGYLDVTSHFLVEPANVQFDWGQIPLCMLMGFMTGTAIYSCDPQEAVVRAAYWRLDKSDPDGDFEPFENTQSPLDIFGNPGGIGDSASLGDITAPLETYDPGYTFTDAGYHRFMAIHNLWQQSHQTRGSCKVNKDCASLLGRADSECLPSGTCSVPCSYETRDDRDGNGTDDQCEADITHYEGNDGSQCSARNRCTIPYRDRDVKPIKYFVNRETPDALQDRLDSAGKVVERGPTEDLAYTWSQALSVAVAHAREVECRRTTQGTQEQRRSDCHAQFFQVDSNGDDETQMVSYGGWGIATPLSRERTFDICHNPVRSYDSEACGQTGTTARDGDVRKNFLIYWPYRTEAGYGGLGNWRSDPITGQIIGAAATTIGESASRSAARSRDIALVALGKLSLTDITDGVSAFRFEKELRDGRAPKQWTSEELLQRTQQFDVKHLSQNVSLGFANGRADKADATTDNNLAAIGFKQSLQLNSGLTNKNLLRFQTLSKPLLGTRIETDLIDSNWLADGLGMNPRTQITDELMPAVSPLRGQAAGNLAQMTQRVHQELGARGVCHLDDGMDSAASVGSPDIANLGAYYRKKYPDLGDEAFAEQVYEDLWKQAYKGIALHEIGHSLGLLHNFTSSFDAMNYNPQYWQLRTNEGQSAASCAGVPRTGAQDTCMGPRYLDPETADELGRGSEPRPGLTYFGHTSTMEYQTARFFESVGLGQYDVMAMGALYGRVLETLDSRDFTATQQRRISPVNMTQLTDEWQLFDGNVHYTELARTLKLFAPERCRAATEEETAQGEWRIVHGKVCAPPRKDYGHWDDFVNTTPDGLAGKKIRIPSDLHAPASGNLRWQYRFGGDISNSYLHVNPFDSGADAFEVSKEAIEKFDYEYPFQYFRAKRRNWQTYRLPSQASRTFFERLRSYHWVISSESAFFNEVAPTRFQTLANDDNGLRPYLLAETEMFNAISRMLLLPEPGPYANNSSLPSGVLDVASRSNSFTLDASDARFISPSFDSSPDVGGSWKYSDFYRRSGFSVEKSLAAHALVNGTPTLYVVSRDVYLDDRNLHISFRTDMPRGVDRVLGGILAEDWKTIAPFVDSNSNPEVKMRDLLSQAPAALDTRAREVFPNIGYSQQLPTLVFSYLFGSMSEDITLSTKMRIWLQGSISGELNVPESEQIRFADPDTGITYVARRFGSEELYGKQVDSGIGSRMLARANELLAQAYQVELDRDGATVLNEFGQPEVSRDSGIPVRLDDAEKLKLYRRYVTLLDAAVRVGTLIGHGPVGE